MLNVMSPEMSREALQYEQALLLLQEGVTWAETKRRVG